MDRTSRSSPGLRGRTSAEPAYSRRKWAKASCAGLVGLNLWGLLRAQAATETRTGGPAASQLRSCVFLFFYGGPSHLDTFDMKPDAPSEIRGEFRPISTSVPGLQVCEHLPHLSRLMHKVALVRTMHHANRLHDSASIETFTGRPGLNGDREEFAPIAQFFPCLGSVVHYLRRHEKLDVHHAVLPWLFHNVIDVPCQAGGFLGSTFDPFRIAGDPGTLSYHASMLDRPEDLAMSRIQARRQLLGALESATQITASSPSQARELTSFYDKAYTLLGSKWLPRALDIAREDSGTRERYGLSSDAAQHPGTGAQNAYGRNMRGQNLLLARRLVEAGVPFVNVHDFRQQGQNWDAHSDNFDQHKNHLLPPADKALSALIEDLDGRGLLDTTLVVALGEFGRTPRINSNAGRDHWPDCYTILLAGGGIKGGYVHGTSDKIAAYPASDPVTPSDLAATIYWRFGINPKTEIHDQTGRPYRLSDGTPLRELFV